MGGGQRKLLRPCKMHAVVIICQVGRKVSPRHRSEDCLGRNMCQQPPVVVARPWCRLKPMCLRRQPYCPPATQLSNEAGFGRPTGPEWQKVHSQITFRIQTGTNEDPELSWSGVLFFAHSRYGVSTDFMPHVTFGFSANRQIVIPSPPHVPGWDSQLTGVSEASIAAACLLGRRTFCVSSQNGVKKKLAGGDDNHQTNIRLSAVKLRELSQEL